MTGILIGVVAGVAAYLLTGAGGRARLPSQGSMLRPTAVTIVGAAAAGSLAIGVLHGTRLVLAFVALAVALAVARGIRRRRRAAEAETRAEQVLALCDGLVTDLQAGQPPVTALHAAAREWPELAPVATAASLGADVPTAFRSMSAAPGATQLRVVAAAWQVAHRSGAGLAGSLAMAAARLREDRATARVVATELAAAQATARLLALLPFGVLLLGSSLGGDPVGFLLDTPPGLVCLCLGLGLAYLGVSWLARIADQVVGS
jgi:tight adherence protein B